MLAKGGLAGETMEAAAEPYLSLGLGSAKSLHFQPETAGDSCSQRGRQMLWGGASR